MNGYASLEKRIARHLERSRRRVQQINAFIDLNQMCQRHKTNRVSRDFVPVTIIALDGREIVGRASL